MAKIITQIYGIRTLPDAKMVVDLGADHIGVSYGKVKRTPGMLNFEQAREIFNGIGSRAVRVGLTVSTEMEEIVEMVTTLMPDVLHLSGDIAGFSPNDIKELKRRVPGLKVMQAIPANDPRVYQYVKEYEEVSDFFLIDTVTSGASDIGATGLTHDLQIDKKIVESTKVPCIIAGGLGPANVTEAIRIVRPYGVDSFTRTNLDKPDGMNLKDPVKVKAFIDAVRAVE
ncbi:MAG: phosphoribosylanthranilate isomerase [Anaerolineaceae bacterium]|nr:MAG: phosphoribosylanthranilate isomerase [Anaerolineaceae bacterium]